MRVREVITICGWLNGSEEIYTQTFSDELVVINSLEECDWDWKWWEPSELPDNEDLKIIVKYFPESCEDIVDGEPLACFETWQSEISGE